MHAFNITSPLVTPFVHGDEGEEVVTTIESADGTVYRLTDSWEVNPTPNGEEFAVLTRMVDEVEGGLDLLGAWVMSMPAYGQGDIVLEWDEFYAEG